MFNNWRVMTSTINMSDGESDEVTRKETEKEARDFYLNQLSSLGTNPQTKGLAIKLINTDGIVVEQYFVDNAQYIVAEEVVEE